MSKPIRRIAICTGGGDAPGLNAVIRATVTAAANRGWETLGIRDGFSGILDAHRYPKGGGVEVLTRDRVRGIAHLGGTIIGTTNKGNPFHYPMIQPDGSVLDTDRSGEILNYFEREGIDALVSIGGDGSLTIANELHRRGLRVVGVPKTIDNDLDKTFTTFGFDTAVSFATECLDRLHSTAESHHRVMVVEVMGRYAGWIALHAGIAGGAHAILIPEIPYDLDQVSPRLPSVIPKAACTAWWWLRKAQCPSRVGEPLLRPQKSAMLSGWVGWVSRLPKRWDSAPVRTRGWRFWVICCGVVAPPRLTVWLPCGLVLPRYGRWTTACPASWWPWRFPTSTTLPWRRLRAA